MAGGGGGGTTWIKVLGLGLALLTLAHGLVAAHVELGFGHPALLAVGGLMVIFGSCEAMILCVQGVSQRMRWNPFVAGTMGGLAANVPELIMLGFVFFYLNGGFWQADRATLQQLFIWAPRGLSFLIVPVVTMRLLAEEKRAGTLEMLITLPVKDHEVILGKFLGAWGLVLILIASTALYPLMMFKFPWHLGGIDFRAVWSGYLGLVLYSAAAVSIAAFSSG